MVQEPLGGKLTRRGLIGLMGMSAAGVLLAACGAAPAPTAAPKPTEAPKPAATTAPAAAPAVATTAPPPPATAAPKPTDAPKPTEVAKPTAAATTAPAKGKVTLRYQDWKLTEEPAGTATKENTKAFRDKHPDIDVVDEGITWGDHFTKLMIQIQGGSPPDSAHIADEEIVPLGTLQGILPLNDLAKKVGKDDIFSLLPQEARKALQLKGQDYFLGLMASIDILTWNTKLYQEAGLDPTKPAKTWDELVEQAKKLTDPKKDQYGWGIMGAREQSGSRRVLAWMMSAGAKIFNDAKTEVVLNSPEGIKGLTFWADLALKHKVVPPGAANAKFADVMTGYAQEKIAMYEGGPNNPMLSEAKSPGILKKSSMGAMPEPWKPSTSLDGLVIPAATKAPELAYLLGEHMTSVDSVLNFGIKAYTVPARADAAKDPRLKEHPLIVATVEQLGKAGPRPWIHPKWNEIVEFVYDMMAAVLTNQTPQAALAEFANRSNAVLKRG